MKLKHYKFSDIFIYIVILILLFTDNTRLSMIGYIVVSIILITSIVLSFIKNKTINLENGSSIVILIGVIMLMYSVLNW